jgi:RNA polymerase sigma-70 factor (ECF subfamily)
VADGDEQAFEELYDLVAPVVHSIVRSVVRDPAQSQEVTQEVFLEAWQTADRFDASLGSAKAWLLLMARRRAVDHVRAAQASNDRDVAVASASVLRDADVVVDAVETRLAQEDVRRCLQDLTGLQRQVLTLAFYEGHTHREVSELLAVPLGTVKTRMRDGLIRLRDCMGDW